ncbi:NAD(P)H-dependent oxidoreductase [Amycolatopsis sp. PS_44_ISF1]|uniref:NADPH-dependent FMN reductase n=1 Tax=Amycolatopsis sp. PS_44_ISF1 TaxID=2974917 RepID=UPI0028DFD790|nr:NAD(P)H-dependent oxidoreductase [Amycolatopsis sp. PS_44_ISF1]MDT8910368.1 NAD(P)H-dependent oxidoreductase [Amycolatopsis sp. PS_44_ISF1]
MPSCGGDQLRTPGGAPRHTKDWSAKIAEAFAFVMPEYNYAFHAELKNALDHLPHEWRYKAVGLVSYGGVAAGTRAALMIEQVVSALRSRTK